MSYYLHLHILKMAASISQVLHITIFSTLNANILRTRGDAEKRSTAFFLILSDLTSENDMFFWVNFPFKSTVMEMALIEIFWFILSE